MKFPVVYYFHGIQNYFKSDYKKAWQYVDDDKAFSWDLAFYGYSKNNGSNWWDMRLGVTYEATVEGLNKFPTTQHT